MRMLVLAAAVALAGAQAAPPRAQIQSAGSRNAIVGRVTTPDGAPVAGAVVTLMERAEYRGRQQWRFVDARLQIVTDADGHYAIPQARLGEFYVVVIPHNPSRSADGRPNRSGFAMTYFPSARTAETATPVMVTVREVQTADIKLIAAPLAVVSGTVFDSKLAAVPNARLSITHGDHLFGIDNASAVVRPDGGFALSGIPPGTYYLQYREGPWPPPRGEMGRVSMAKVVVDGRDISGVRVVPVDPVEIEGRLVMTDADRAHLPPDLTVVATPVSFDGNPGPRPPGAIRADLAFSFRTWPGVARIRVLPEDEGWIVRRVRYRGVDVTESGIDFKAGEKVSGVEVEFGRGR